jgi:hypothetical protein
MSKTVLLAILCVIFALPASADAISSGKITSVESGGNAFTTLGGRST